MTLDGIPYESIHSDTPNLYVATGFGKWGMTTASAAMILRDNCRRIKPWQVSISPAKRFGFCQKLVVENRC